MKRDDGRDHRNAVETAIKKLRSQIGDAPREAEHAIRETLRRYSGRPTYVARFLGLLGKVSIYLGNLEMASKRLRAAGNISRISPVARAEILLHWATYYFVLKDYDCLIDSAVQAIAIMDAIPERDAKTKSWARRHAKVRTDIKAAALIWLGRGRHLAKLDGAREPLEEALSLDPSNVQRRGALVVLSEIISGDGEDVEAEVLERLNDAERLTPRSDKYSRMEIRICRGVVTAKLGDPEKGERLIRKSLACYRRKNLVTAFMTGLDRLEWVISEAAGKPDRAAAARKALEEELATDRGVEDD